MKEGSYNNEGLSHYMTVLTHFRGDWDTEGVTVVRIYRENSTIICSSTHLTSFAVLVDVSDGHQVCNNVINTHCG